MAEDLTWDSESDWDGAQDSEDVEIDGGTFLLADAVPESETYQTHRWIFNDNSGDVAKDDVGSLDADFGSDISWGSGAGAKSVYGDLSGGTSLGTQSEFTSFTEDGEGSIGVWIYFESESIMAIMSSWVDYSDIGILFEVSNDIIVWSMRDGNDWQWEISGGSLNEEEWTPVVVTADGTDAYIYIGEDMSEEASQAIGNTISGNHSNEMHIGEYPDDADEYDGGMSFLWTSDTGVTQTEAKDWANKTSEYFD